MKKYCFNCGSKLEFSVKEKPKFCVQCGKPLEFESSSDAHDEDGESHEAEVEISNINIQGLAFDFDPGSLKIIKDTVGSLMGTLDKVSDNNTSTDFPSVTKDEVLEQYKKEAGTLRNNQRSKKEDGEA
jgi:hypothetical protein